METIRSVIMMLNGSPFCEITEEAVFRAFPQSDAAFLRRDWKTACEYLSQFVGTDGVCRLDPDIALDSSTLDYARNIAVFMLFTAMLESGVINRLPLQTAMRAIPVITARMAASEMDMAKHQRMDSFVAGAGQALEAAPAGDLSIDEVFARIFEDIPSVKSFSTVMEPDRGRYLTFFEMLYERAQACADPHYSAEIEQYIEVLEGELP